jgi:pyruvate/2-oxoglutarate dehydrogenase complex dihydrolipoamide acyltransferase (E2) component
LSIRKIIRLPRLDEAQETARIVEWHKKVGDYVKKGDKIVTIETMKVIYDVESEYEGVITEIYHSIGEELPVGEPLCSIEVKDGSPKKLTT